MKGLSNLPTLDAPDPKRRALDRPIRPTRAEIQLEALRHNFRTAQQLAQGADILAVVKANAYGHGAVMIARALEEAGAKFLAVALVEEGVELRHAGIKTEILVLGGAYEGGYEAVVAHTLIPTVFRQDHLEGLAAAAKARGQRVRVHLKVDTGMGRVGILPSELDAFLDAAAGFPEVHLDGLLSHFANADLQDPKTTDLQIERFRQASARMKERGIPLSFRHLSNSAAVLERPELREQLELNLVRPGIMLYGYAPAQRLVERAPLRPVLSWKTAVTHLKTVPAGTAVSYGGTWVAERSSVLATLPIGYADGYSRALSNRGQVLVRGKRAPIAGRVCMDMCVVDVTDIPGVGVGDEVVLLGSQGSERIDANDLAALLQTLNYEVLCGVGARVPRVVISG